MVDTTKLAPGVYIQEITPAGPIAGAGTSTAAFIGTAASAAKADLGVPVLVVNWNSFASRFGGYSSALPLPYAVRGFFENGGTLAYIVAVTDWTGLPGALDQLTRVLDVNRSAPRAWSTPGRRPPCWRIAKTCTTGSPSWTGRRTAPRRTRRGPCRPRRAACSR